MARRLGLPSRTWYNCETGESIPGEILVLLVERTRCLPDVAPDRTGNNVAIRIGVRRERSSRVRRCIEVRGNAWRRRQS